MPQAYFPDAHLVQRKGYLDALWDRTGTKGTAIAEYGLSKEFMRPIRRFERFDPDPLAGMIGAMAELHPGDTALFQVLFAPTRNPWTESIVRAVMDNEGDSFFADDPTTVFDKAHGMVVDQGVPNALQSTYRETDGENYTVLWPWSLTEFNVL